MDTRDSEIMIRLAREGKQISKIWEEDFPQYHYGDIYFEVYGAGEKSALGAKRMISTRLKKLTSVSKTEQLKMIEEINDLVWHLYDRHKENQHKLDDIREIINK